MSNATGQSTTSSAPDRIVITGAAGFIGSHLCERLLALSYEVVGVDNFNDFYSPAIKRDNLRGLAKHASFRLIEADIRDREAMHRALAGASCLIHLAAMAGVRPSMTEPALYEDVNCAGTVTLLESCRAQGIRKILFASSSSVYGNNRKAPFAETDAVDHPISMYAATKRAGELYCHTYHALYGLDVICLRFFTVYGPRQRPDLAIHKFARLIRDGHAVPFFGDGSMERDYTFIDDIVDGVVAALDRVQGIGYRIINLGSDRPVRLDALLGALEAALGKAARLERLVAPPCEVARTWADLTSARAVLSYQPRTSLEHGLAQFIVWFNQGPVKTPTYSS